MSEQTAPEGEETVDEQSDSVYSTATRVVTITLEVVNADLDRNDLKPAEMWSDPLQEALEADRLGLVYALGWEVREQAEAERGLWEKAEVL